MKAKTLKSFLKTIPDDVEIAVSRLAEDATLQRIPIESVLIVGVVPMSETDPARLLLKPDDDAVVYLCTWRPTAYVSKALPNVAQRLKSSKTTEKLQTPQVQP